MERVDPAPETKNTAPGESKNGVMGLSRLAEAVRGSTLARVLAVVGGLSVIAPDTTQAHDPYGHSHVRVCIKHSSDWGWGRFRINTCSRRYNRPYGSPRVSRNVPYGWGQRFLPPGGGYEEPTYQLQSGRPCHVESYNHGIITTVPGGEDRCGVADIVGGYGGTVGYVLDVYGSEGYAQLNIVDSATGAVIEDTTLEPAQVEPYRR